MIIIDEAARERLAEALRGMVNAEHSHCLRIHPLEGNQGQIRQMIVSHVQAALPDADLYCCDDHEMFLLSHTAPIKECRKAMFVIASTFKIQPAEHLGELYELGSQSGALLKLLERKIETDQHAQEMRAKQQAQQAAAALAMRKRQEILDQNVRRNAQEIATQRKERSEPVIMIIEDDPFSRRLVENVLQKRFRLVGLASAESALPTYAECAPDLLFLDINLPDVTGHELLEKIIALDPKAYVVMLSGNADRDNIMQAMQRGAVGFVAKPFSREKLLQYIERCPTICKEKVL